MARAAQITQHNKHAVSLQNLKKELSHEVDVFYGDKHESLLQVDGFGQTCPKYQGKFAKSLCQLKKEVRNGVRT